SACSEPQWVTCLFLLHGDSHRHALHASPTRRSADLASLDSALLNGGNGAVSFGATDGSLFYVFATDPSTVFSPGTVCTLTANFADGTTASATVTVPVIPTITSVTPSTGAPGTSARERTAGTSSHVGATAAVGGGNTEGATRAG